VTEPSSIVIQGADAAGPRETAGGRRTSGRRGRKAGQRIPSRWRAVFLALTAAGVIGVGAWALFYSPLLVVRSVSVHGARLVPSAKILAASGVTPGTPLIRVNTGRAAARIAAIRQVSSVQVSTSWPDRVVIVVRERTPVLAVAAPGGGYDLVDAAGVMVRRAAKRPAGLPLYSTTMPVAGLPGSPDLAAAAAVLRELPAGVRHRVTSVTAPGPDQVTLRLTRRITVLWGDTSRAAEKARELAVLLRGHMHYFDVSAPGSVLAR
jgi:cell division protein FtsQ